MMEKEGTPSLRRTLERGWDNTAQQQRRRAQEIFRQDTLHQPLRRLILPKNRPAGRTGAIARSCPRMGRAIFQKIKKPPMQTARFILK
jgi:hypothetical protein